LQNITYFTTFIYFLVTAFSICTPLTVGAEESPEICSRTATINYQEVLIDASSQKKGEGLRFYLNKDPIAKGYLDEYQGKSRPRWYNAVIGTLGTGLILAAIVKSGKSSNQGQFSSSKGLAITGASLIFINFLVAQAQESQNEKILNHAIEEYNKRNLPKIYFSPFKKDSSSGKRGPSSEGIGFIFGLTQRF